MKLERRRSMATTTQIQAESTSMRCPPLHHLLPHQVLVLILTMKTFTLLFILRPLPTQRQLSSSLDRRDQDQTPSKWTCTSLLRLAPPRASRPLPRARLPSLMTDSMPQHLHLGALCLVVLRHSKRTFLLDRQDKQGQWSTFPAVLTDLRG